MTMPNPLTVADLIAALSKLPPETPLVDVHRYSPSYDKWERLTNWNGEQIRTFEPPKEGGAICDGTPLDFGATDSNNPRWTKINVVDNSETLSFDPRGTEPLLFDPRINDITQQIADGATDGTVDIPAYVKLVNQHFGLQNIKPTSNTLPIVEKYIAECEENNGAGDYDGEIRLLEKLRDEIAAIQ